MFFPELEQIIAQFVWRKKKKNHKNKTTTKTKQNKTKQNNNNKKNQKTSDSQSNLEKEEWNWRNQPAWLQAILQSCSYQVSMLLTRRQKYRSMEQYRKLRDKSTHLWSLYLSQRTQEYTMEKIQISLTSGTGKTGQPPVK